MGIHEPLGGFRFLVLTIFTLVSKAYGAAPLEFDISDGDHITCVDIEKQMSFKFRNATAVHYQSHPSRESVPGPSTYDRLRVKRTTQLLLLESSVLTNKTCPSETIPVRKNRGFWFDDAAADSQDSSQGVRGQRLRAERARRFARTSNARIPMDSNWTVSYNWTRDYNFTGFNFTRNRTLTPHEYGVVGQNVSKSECKFKGMEGAFSINAPFVAGAGEFSLGQLWLMAGSYEADDLNTIEAGFQVSAGAYGDSRPRLFVFWTNGCFTLTRLMQADAYKNKGCYNLECPGFVQVSNNVLLGGSFATISQINGTQYEMTLRVFKDDESGNWWLKLNDENVGYWPRSIFTRLSDVADDLSWGGEIVDDQPHADNHHTETDMGSGEFADSGFARSAFVRTLQFVDVNNTLRDAPITAFASDPGCYSVQIGSRFKDWGSYFFYGGRGYSRSCLSHKSR